MIGVKCFRKSHVTAVVNDNAVLLYSGQHVSLCHRWWVALAIHVLEALISLKVCR